MRSAPCLPPLFPGSSRGYPGGQNLDDLFLVVVHAEGFDADSPREIVAFLSSRLYLRVCVLVAVRRLYLRVCVLVAVRLSTEISL
jgi:hypothetical protein